MTAQPDTALGLPELTVKDYRYLQDSVWTLEEQERVQTRVQKFCQDFLDYARRLYPELHQQAMRSRRPGPVGSYPSEFSADQRAAHDAALGEVIEAMSSAPDASDEALRALGRRAARMQAGDFEDQLEQ